MSNEKSAFIPCIPKRIMGALNTTSRLLKDGFVLVATFMFTSPAEGYITFQNPSQQHGPYSATLDCDGTQEANITAIAKEKCGIYNLVTDGNYGFGDTKNYGSAWGNLGPACTYKGPTVNGQPLISDCVNNVTASNVKNGLFGPQTTNILVGICIAGTAFFVTVVGLSVCAVRRRIQNNGGSFFRSRAIEGKPLVNNGFRKLAEPPTPL